MAKHSLSMIDLFAGAGGLSYGMQQAGFTPLYANEFKAIYAKTYAINHPGAVTDQRDIRAVDASRIKEQLGIERGCLDVLVGGPPCQGFSINAPQRDLDDQRNQLFRDYLRFVDVFSPHAVLIENVPGLVSFDGGQSLANILDELGRLGYRSEVKLLYAPHFGVPQTRWRTFILGMRDGQDPNLAFPIPQRTAPLRINFTSTFAGKKIVLLPNQTFADFTSVQEAIDDLPCLKNGQAHDAALPYRTPPQNAFQEAMRHGTKAIFNHEAPRLGAVNLKRLAHIPQGGNWTDIPFELLPKGMKRARRNDHTKRYGRTDPQGLACTILTKCDPHWGAYFHYNQDRVFTVREAARLQSFPDTFQFFGSRSEQYEQVGNAVPPLLAKALGQAIRSCLYSQQKQLQGA